ncbi:MAG TPA: GntR family transcriptional regulator, partial [Phycisphaeraceae bacterium]
MLAKQNQKAYEYLRRELLRGAFLPGTRLSDYALSKKINIGRGPIREAIGRLESEGFVEQIPRHGTFVRKLDRSEIEDLYDLRIL